MRRILPVLLALGASLLPASGASLSKSYSYFPITGMTLLEIERQLQTRGPLLDSTGQRHPGATNMEFTTRVDYAENDGRCRIADARVSVQAKVTLPRWRDRQHAKNEVRLIWDTLSRDIKRHEESHLIIAKNHARQLEERLKALPRRRDCRILANDVKRVTAETLDEHDAEQSEFDRVESINFESRIMRLLRYRLQQIETGGLAP